MTDIVDEPFDRYILLQGMLLAALDDEESDKDLIVMLAREKHRAFRAMTHGCKPQRRSDDLS